ncbi:unnamed protein product [Chondrus crispus]|uniref:GOLD domain-containing protein n=1 Tax=Chondrus crispus TaxID=2769 RepID=R7Q8I7_CHOCR|nr:unnamed protein product [Chondrus crispus]CDF33795.1 unnamed protein product [Chondrus crispus]|eukprot:XP_005713614.1 unnamed protein product [Chondrus crispus]
MCLAPTPNPLDPLLLSPPSLLHPAIRLSKSMVRPHLSLSNLVIVLLALHVLSARALRFHLEDREKRCFTFSASHSIPIRGSVSVLNGVGEARLALTIRDSTARTVFEAVRGNKDTGSKFSFKVPYGGAAGREDAYGYDEEDFDAPTTFSACLLLTFDDAVHRPGVKRAVQFAIDPQIEGGTTVEDVPANEVGVVAVAKRMQLMERIMTGLAADLIALQQRERRLVARTEATGGRLLILSVVSYIILVAVATLQISHIKTFFKSKKLL